MRRPDLVHWRESEHPGGNGFMSTQPTKAINNQLRGLSPRWISGWVAISYAVCASLYVIVSGRLLSYLVNDPARLSEFQTYKTLLLVAVSAVLISELTYRAVRKPRRGARVRTDNGGAPTSLRSQINWLIVAVALPLVCMLVYLIYGRARDAAAAARETVQAAARVVAADSGRFIASNQQKLGAVALRVGAQGVPGACEPAFDYFTQLNPEFTVLLLWSPQGEVLCPARFKGTRYADARRPDWLPRTVASRKPMVSEPYRGPLSGRWITVIAHPVFSASGELVGVLDLSIDLGNFTPVTAPVGSSVEVLAILDGRGRVAATAAATAASIDDASREQGLVPLVAANQREGHALSRGADGVERIYGFAPIAGTDWVALAGVPVGKVFEKANQSLVASMLLALAIVLLVSYLSYRVSLHIERPIIITARTAQAVADGDMSVRAPVIGPAETRVVARQFNAMLDGRAEAQKELQVLLEQERLARGDAERARGELAGLRDNLEIEVSQRTRELSERNREMETFSYSVSHDVRTPLRSIHGYTSILVAEYGERLDAEGRLYLKNIIDSVERMDALTQGLLILAQVSRSHLSLDPVDLGAIARSVLDEMRKADPERNVTEFVADCEAVRADAVLMRTVLENLLGNAWKYTANRAHAEIEFGHAPDAEGHTVYFVRDNGAGFDMAFVGRLFQPFQRLHRTAEFPGTGIGLATVRRIIERHGGSIWAQSVPQQGTTISFTLGL